MTTDDTTTIASSIASSTPWPADNISCADFLANNPGSLTPRQDSGNISVKITAPLQAGTYTYTANFEATESPAGSDDQQDLANTTIAQNPAVKKLVQATYIVTVPSNTAPTVPGAPTTNSNPNQGAFTLDWTASTDAQSNPITYELQHKDANDPGYTTVTGAGSLNTNSYTFGGSNAAEAEGTWTYQVKASDGSLSSAFSPASSLIKVDKSKPNAPNASADRPVDYDGTGSNDWYKDTVTVSFSANGDPNLLDGSAGSGVNLSTLTGPIIKSTSGPHTVSGTVKDNVGLESDPGSLTVQVDATNPTVNITGCPTGVVGHNSTHNILSPLATLIPAW